MKSARFALHSASAATMSALGGGAIAPYGQFPGAMNYSNTYGDGSGFGAFDRHPSVAEEAARAAKHKSALRKSRGPRLRTR